MSFGQWKPTITLKYQPFPKQACIHKIINEPIDSNPQDDIYNLGEHPCQKASLCSFFKGSYTLEAAVIIPVAAVFFLTLLFFFRVLQIQTEVQEALNYASRKTACEASAVSSQTGLLVSAEAYFRKELGTYSLPEKYIRGGKHAITMAKSDLSGNYINLQVNYYIKIPISFFEVKESTVNNPDGSVRINRTTKVTGRGQTYFVNKFLDSRDNRDRDPEDVRI